MDGMFAAQGGEKMTSLITIGAPFFDSPTKHRQSLRRQAV
jgi:hypothetical protein